MKIKDLQTGEIYEYGTNGHHALSISKDGRTLSFENLQNGDGSRYGDYRFVLDDGMTPEESDSAEARHCCCYANIGGFKTKAEEQDNHRWIPVSERLPEDTEKSGYIILSFENFDLPDIGRYEVDDNGDGTFYPGDDEKSYISHGLFVNAWMPLPEPYKENDNV